MILACGHKALDAPWIVRVDGSTREYRHRFLGNSLRICAHCWQPGTATFRVGPALGASYFIYGLYGADKRRLPTDATACAGCGVQVVRGARSGLSWITCSEPCTRRASQLAQRRTAQWVTAICAQCGEAAISKYGRRYCSNACKQRAYRLRQHAGSNRGASTCNPYRNTQGSFK